MSAFYRLPVPRRFAEALVLRGKSVRVVTRDGWSTRGVIVAVGTALHGTSTDWLAIKGERLDRFVSLAAIVSIEKATK